MDCKGSAFAGVQGQSPWPCLTKPLSGWGNYPRIAVRQLAPAGRAGVLAALAAEPGLIARGNGRAYGDAALNPRATLSMLGARGLLAFDPEAGRVTVEAGLLLGDLIEKMLPHGWFVPVTPGTKFVSVGGAVAADVHGKNHHGAGSFSAHVEAFDMALADGRVLTCSATEHPDIFAATCGGMGLTGLILAVTLRLLRVETSLIRQETRRCANLADVMAAFEDARHWSYSVAWIDCLARGASLGRSLLFLGEHARRDEAGQGRGGLLPTRRRPVRVPVDFPSWALNRWSVAAFNELYWRRARPGTAFVDYDRYFYPLDAILEWNRIYGRAGFVQYQCVLPKAASDAGLTALLTRISRAGAGSFLSVLKLFGAPAKMLSFPLEGFTLALDFPANRTTFALLDELDAIVADHGGRLYLAKDARMGAALFRRGYPHLPEFEALRTRIDPEQKFWSVQSRRLGL
jgi:decaprenylphospho-beta-D-ribofuranose 2-oxidase